MAAKGAWGGNVRRLGGVEAEEGFTEGHEELSVAAWGGRSRDWEWEIWGSGSPGLKGKGRKGQGDRDRGEDSSCWQSKKRVKRKWKWWHRAHVLEPLSCKQFKGAVPLTVKSVPDLWIKAEGVQQRTRPSSATGRHTVMKGSRGAVGRGALTWDSKAAICGALIYPIEMSLLGSKVLYAYTWYIERSLDKMDKGSQEHNSGAPQFLEASHHPGLFLHFFSSTMTLIILFWTEAQLRSGGTKV